MKTAYYTFTTWNDGAMAAGFDSAVGGERRTAMVRQTEQRTRVPEEEKVIDLTAWRAANPELVEEEREEPVWDGGGSGWEREGPEELSAPVPRPRRSRRTMLTAELVSTLSVVAAALALIVRVLTF